MARFRRLGRNWEKRPWATSPAINALMDEVEEAFPDSHRGDGTVASKAHDAANPMSDHRPYPLAGPGVVNAVDVGENIEDEGWFLAEAIRASRDPRVRYVQHEGQLFSSYSRPQRKAWEWGPVGGNPHVDHVHVSVLRDKQNDGRLWQLGLDTMTPEEVRAVVREELDRRQDGRPGPVNEFRGITHGAWSARVNGADGPSQNQYLIRTKANTDLLVGTVATDTDIDLLVSLIKDLPADVVDEIARRLALPGPR